MGANGLDEYWVPERVKDYLRKLGFVLPLDDMEPWIRSWDDWMSARGDFYDYRDKDGMGRVYEVHRRSIHPAMRVCKEWGSLLLNEDVKVVSENQAVDQLQMHLKGGGAFFSPMGGTDSTDPLVLDTDTYRIVTIFFDHEGNELLPTGISRLYDTGCPYPTFGIVRPAVTNTRVDMSPYGQSVFADAVDAVQAVNLTFDALVNEVDLSKMRVFLSDVLFDRSTDGNKTVTIPFGRQDCTVFRKVMSTEDTIQEFAPALRTGSQIEAFRVSLQMLGDLCGFGIQYFDVSDSRGYIKTATEVSSDNSALMRNIRRHENALEGAITGIGHALLHVSRGFGEMIPDEGDLRVQFDDSIVQDMAAEKEQDMKEVGVTMSVAEFRMKWYGEDESTAVARASEIAGGKGPALYGFGAGLPFTDEDGNYKAGYRRKLTFGEINGGLNYVADENAKLVWGRWNADRTAKVHSFGQVTFSEVTEPERLLALTRRALADAVQPKVSYEVDVAALDGDDADLGDTVAVIDTSRDPEWRLTARVVRRVRTFGESVVARVTICTVEPVDYAQVSALAADVATLRDDVVGIDGNLTTAASVTVVENTVTTAIDDLDELSDLDF